ncbi:MAG: transporter [Pseudomonadales bacterium]|nr:transporter [Pseudomonadales bacterium]
MRYYFNSVSVLGSALLVLAMPARAEESNATLNEFSLGGYYSKGDYGQSIDTSIRYFPFSYTRTVGHWNLQASVPRLEISGAGNVLVNVGGLGRDEFDSVQGVASQTQRGLGDTTLSATYQMPAFSSSAPFIDLGFEIKAPTADENKGLGTGAYDYGLHVDLYQQWGQTTLFGTLGYKWRGTSTLFSEMQDSAFVSLGFTRPLAPRWSTGLIYDFREAASANSGETHELLPYLSWAVASQWTLMGYVVKGFTEDSADRAVGIQLNYRW